MPPPQSPSLLSPILSDMLPLSRLAQLKSTCGTADDLDSGLRPFTGLPFTPFQNSQWMPQWVLEGKGISQKHPFYRPQHTDTSEKKQRVLNHASTYLLSSCQQPLSPLQNIHLNRLPQNHDSTCYKSQPLCLHTDHFPRPRNQTTR